MIKANIHGGKLSKKSFLFKLTHSSVNFFNSSFKIGEGRGCEIRNYVSIVSIKCVFQCAYSEELKSLQLNCICSTVLV